MTLVFATKFGNRLETLEQKRTELGRLLQKEFHPRAIQGLLDQLKDVNSTIRTEKRKFTL